MSLKNFNLKNIITEPISTLFALAIVVICFWFVYSGKSDFMSVSGVLLLVVPFLLYGKNNNDNNGNCPTPPAAMFLLLLLLWVFGCKPQQVIREVQVIRDTIHVKGETIERNFHYAQKDTVFVKGDKLTMKYYYHHHDSTVFLQGACKADTIITEKLIPFEKVVIEEKNNTFDWLILLACLILPFVVGFFVGKR
jgi:hypothetical protein